MITIAFSAAGPSLTRTDRQTIAKGTVGTTSRKMSDYDLTELTDCNYMFFNSTISSFDPASIGTKNATYMTGMFQGCAWLSSIDLTKLDMSSVEYPSHMFDGAGVSSLDFYGKTCNLEAAMMFANCSNLTKVFIPSTVKNLWLHDYDEPDGTMFENCNSSCVIYTDAPSQPSGWITGWNYMMMGSASTALTVKWGSTHEEFLAA